MNTEVERFHNAVRGSSALREGLHGVDGPEAFVSYARQNGYNFSAADLQGWNQKRLEGNLSTADLDNVVGGRDATGSTGAGSNSPSDSKGKITMDAIYEAAWRTFWY